MSDLRAFARRFAPHADPEALALADGFRAQQRQLAKRRSTPTTSSCDDTETLCRIIQHPSSNESSLSSSSAVREHHTDTREPSPTPHKRARIHAVDANRTFSTPSYTYDSREEETETTHEDPEDTRSTRPEQHSPDDHSSAMSFPLMKLPPEIRNEIYRACLTRPFNIFLSRNPPPSQEQVPDEELLMETGAMILQTAEPSPDALLAATTMEAADATADTSELPGEHRWSVRQPHRRLLAEHLQSDTGTWPGTEPSDAIHDEIAARIAARFGPRAQSEPASPASVAEEPREIRPQDEDPLIVNLLRANKIIYQEARSILYSENHFTLKLNTALPTLAALHQRSRRQIKYVELEIPCYNEILERFQETVRLSLRYCWGLKTFIIHMPFVLPGADGSGTTGNTTVYANGFDILRWLPRQCEVVLKGNVCAEIKAVVSKNANLAKTLDELAYARRQLISNETDRG